MASWFTRALDRITPWDRGGEVERRKKREEEQRQANNNWQRSNNSGSNLRVGVAQPNQNIVVDKPKPQRPENLFQDLNQSLIIGNKPKSTLDIIKENNQAAQKPQPGDVVKPTLKVSNAQPKQQILVNGKPVEDTPENKINRGLDAGKSWEQIARENNFRLEGVREYSQATRPNYGITIKKPNQSLGNRFRDIFDANTEADKYRRQEGNKKAVAAGEPEKVKDLTLRDPGNIVSRTPIVGHVTKMVNTAGIQMPQVGLTVQQKFATDEYSEAQRAYTEARKTGDPVRIDAAERRVNAAAKRLSDIQKDLDFVESKFKKNSGGWFNAGTLYDEEAAKRGSVEDAIKDIALPTAVTALDLYTLGKGSTVSEALKQSGKGALRTQAGNIAKMTAGNYLSGDLSARAEGATGWDPIKSGSINAVLGSAPDIGLPLIGRSFKNRVLPKIMSGRGVNPADVVEELDDAAISASAEAANQALKPRPIRVGLDIPVKAPEDIGTPIPVVKRPSGRPLIKELEGDFNFPTFEQLQEIRIADTKKAADAVNSAARPDPRIEGVTPRESGTFKLDDTAIKTSQDDLIDQYAGFLRDVGEGNGTQLIPDGEGGYYRTSNNYRPGMGSGRVTKEQWREEAERQLRAGQADPAIQQAFNDAADPEVQSMLSKGDTTEEAPIGRPIEVKQAQGIPVRDETVVPTDLPETPGQVRVTETTAPMAAKSEAVANAPVVAQPPALPREVQEVLDNPKQFSKRQVAAARNQRKLARAMAKTQEDTVAAMERINASNPRNVAGQPEGYAPTGRFARGEKGNAYEVASRATEAAAGEAEMATRSVDDLVQELAGKESFSPGDRRRIQAALENVAKANPDDRETRLILKKLQSKSRTELAQGLAMWPRVVRRSASADTLTNRWESKIARALDNPSKMTDVDFAEVQRANDAFTLARDTAERLDEQFKRTGSEADFKAWEDAYKSARKADQDAKFTEIAVAKRVLKGEKGAHVNKVLDALKKESDVNSMDLVTANMLSGTATGFRNTFGTELAGVENRLFANTRAKITNALFDENVGGFSRKGAREGRKIGMVKLGRDAARRAEIGGKNPLEWAKNWATTINSGGESSLQSQVYSRLGKYYERVMKDRGFSGKELDMRMRHAMLTDPENMGEIYLDSAMKSSGLTGLFEKGQTIEKAVTDYVGRHTDSKLGQGASKLIMRLAVGFPTATGNFMYQSAKRLTAGLPSYIEMGAKLAKGDKLGAAQAFERGLKETGSGLAVLGFGAALGQAGLISGAYPSDPDERARWEREGISENSIKIGGAWFPIPQGAGMLGLPLMTGAAIGRDGTDGLAEMYNPKNLAKLLPTDQIQGFLNMASGDGAPQDFKNFVASGMRAVTPAGALFNQIAKSFDDTKNDTTTKDLWSNIIDQYASGIPGLNNAMDIPDKTDDAGNPIQNPNPLQLAFGATSASQQQGIERSGEIRSQIDDAIKGIDQYGLLTDKNMEGVLDGKGLEAFTKLKAGKQLDESDVKALKEGLVKGVSSEGTDTAYLERGEYDTNLAVLKLKRDLMKEDKTTKPSSLKDLDTAIKRGEVYKEHQIPYDMISDYKSVGVEDWRKMGDPESDEYDPDMYQMLWDIDQLMTKAGVSYRKGKMDKQKYYEKEKKGSGSRGGSRSRASELSSDFGTLKAGSFAPSVRAYETIDQRSGSVPIIRTVRPNIVHKIGSSG